MPVYAYRCPECRADFEQRRSIAQADDPAPCPDCGSLLTERVFTAPALLGRTAAAPAAGEGGDATVKPRRHRPGCPCC